MVSNPDEIVTINKLIVHIVDLARMLQHAQDARRSSEDSLDMAIRNSLNKELKHRDEIVDLKSEIEDFQRSIIYMRAEIYDLRNEIEQKNLMIHQLNNLLTVEQKAHTATAEINDLIKDHICE